MKRSVFSFILLLILCLALSVIAEKPGDTVTVTFVITDNPQQAISARVGMEFDSRAFEFISAETLSLDVLNSPPTSEAGKFGLLNMGGISPGEIGTIILRIKPDAPVGWYEIKPVVDSVYNAKRETVELTVTGGRISVDHVWDNGRVTVEATCYTEGVMTYTCVYCLEKRTETIPITEHREGPAVVMHVAKCTENGLQIYPCDICHDTLREEIIPAFGHTEGDRVVTQKPTCSVAGVLAVQCANCGRTVRSESIPATGIHTEVVDEAIAATCTNAGKTQGKHCSVCNTVLTAQTTIPAKGHTEVVDEAIAATCTNAGKTQGKHCSICGTVIVKQNEVTALGHSWDGGVITKEPTTEEEGVKTFTCAACKTTCTQSVPKLEIVRMPGDADDNKSVNILDALLTLQHSVGWNVTINTSNADVNANGAVDILDALLILQHSVGWNVDLQ